MKDIDKFMSATPGRRNAMLREEKRLATPVAAAEPEPELSDTEASFLDLARLYCAVSETPSGYLSWTFAQGDMEALAREVISQHRRIATPVAAAEPSDEEKWNRVNTLAELKKFATPVAAAEPTADRKLINICLGLMDAPKDANIVLEVAKLIRPTLAAGPATPAVEPTDEEIVALWELHAPFKAHEIFAPMAFAHQVLALAARKQGGRG